MTVEISGVCWFWRKYCSSPWVVRNIKFHQILRMNFVGDIKDTAVLGKRCICGLTEMANHLSHDLVFAFL